MQVWRRTLVAVAACGVGAFAGCSDGGTEPEERGPPSRIELASAAGPRGAANSVLPTVVVKVTDSEDRAIGGASVQFAVVAGGGSVTPTSARTGNDGTVSAAWRVGTEAGAPNRLVARLLDVENDSVVDSVIVSATVNAGAAARLQILRAPATISLVDQVLGDFRVRITDEFGNPVAGTVVSWRALDGGITLSAPAATTGEDGTASVVATVGRAEGTFRLGVRAGAVTEQVITVEVWESLRWGPLQGPAFGIARHPSGHLITTIFNSAKVDRIDVDSGRFLEISVGDLPTLVNVDADGRFAYVAQMNGPLAIIDLAINRKVADVPIPGGSHALALSPRGDVVYVTNPDANVYAVRVATRAVFDTIPTPAGPWGIAFRVSGADSLMYISTRNGGAIVEADMKTGNVLRTFNVGGRPHGVAMRPGSSHLWIADDAGAVKLLDVASGTLLTSIPLGGAFGIVISADGSRAFASTNAGAIAVVDVVARTIIKTHNVGGQPRQLTVAPDGRSAWAANLGGWIDWVAR